MQYEKKKFDKIRQSYIAAEENLKRQKEASKQNPRNLQLVHCLGCDSHSLQAQEEFDRQKLLYERSGFETIHKLKDVNQRNDFETMEKVHAIILGLKIGGL